MRMVVYLGSSFSSKPRVTVVSSDNMVKFEQWCKQFKISEFWIIDTDNPQEVEHGTIEYSAKLNWS